MNKKHASVAQQTQQIFHDIKTMSHEELENLYGIVFELDGSIFDPTYQQKFLNIQEWATFSAQQDTDDDVEDYMRHKGYHDDDEE